MSWFLRIWLPIAIAVTGMSALVYVAVQQNYRQALNDPQIQMAEDAAAMLDSGIVASIVVPKETVDIAASLKPWIAIYDTAKKPVASSGMIRGTPAAPPAGVFDAAANGNGKDTARTGENRVTWQPSPDVRQAIVIVKTKNGFVVAGRNMREVEQRVWGLEISIALAWLCTLIVTLGVVWASANVAVRDFDIS